MATVYSSTGTCGSSSARQWRIALTYSTSTSDTAVSISWTATIQMKSAAQYGVYLACEGKSTTGVITSSSSSWKDVCSVSGTTSCSKTTSAWTKSLTASGKGQTVSGYGGADGSLSVTASISIPALASYTVSYNANGGSGAPSNQTKYYGTTLTLSSTIPTRDGYTFAGWGTSASATGVSYAAGGSYTANSAITLYAVWTANKTLTISYDANGGADAPVSQTHLYNSTSTLSQGIPTRHGYNFLGWSTSSTATSATYAAGASYTNDDFEDGDVVTLYAVWEESDYLTIVYNVNGGTGTPESQKHYINTKSYITEDKPTKDGYKFLGWTDDSTSSIIKYSAGSVYENDDFTDGDTVTLYAIWMRSIDIKVRVPSGSTLKAVHIRVPDGTGYGTDDLVSSDGYSLVDSSGGQIRVKETN